MGKVSLKSRDDRIFRSAFQQHGNSVSSSSSSSETNSTENSDAAPSSSCCEHVTMATNTSSKYDIPCKVLIPPGSPAVYQLIPKKENIGNVEGITLKRVTLGEKDPNKSNKTILLVGETGTGKSTLINALVNYAMGVEREDEVWFQIVEDEEKKNQSETQTSDVIVYEIFGFEGKTLPYSLTIIDTPGYGDTRGIGEDATVDQRLFQLFRLNDGVHEINAVGLVLKATENRLSDRLRYIFNSVMSLFGKDMEKNIVALVTHSYGLTPENVLQALEDANIKCAKDEEDEPLHFMFNNCQSTQKTKKNKVALKGAWDLTKDQMGQFTDYLKETSPQNLRTTVEVLDTRTRLAACIQNLQERIELTEKKQTEIKQTQEALKKHEQEMKSNEKFTVEVDEPYKVKVPVSEGRWWALWLNHGGAVTCNVCQENCHYPCTLAWYTEHCEVMKGGRCTVCTGKCPASVHVKEKLIYVTKTRKVQKTLQNVKEKYEKNEAGSKSKLSLLETLEKEMEELQKEKDQLLAESFQHVIKLEEIALNVDSLSTHDHVDFLIEKMKEKEDTEKVQKLEEMKGRMEKDKGIKAALSYRFGKIKAASCHISL
ncbi:uncharacterized protein LOC119477699 [Sebastes umbrosus]|uniref:uncharacterized protein LOC119477699 n=1 Tax=Sebastes umbrosus TaxID=72105 RepID=UPI0018A111A7|nr:uncharacterized protein LOC119477699 [Sebastes umbrosus]